MAAMRERQRLLALLKVERNLHEVCKSADQNPVGRRLTAGQKSACNPSDNCGPKLGQALTALKIDVQWIEKRIPTPTSPVQEKIRAIVGLVDRTIQLVQRISSQLRPAMLDDLGLTAATEWLAGDFSRRSGIPCSVDVAAVESRIGGNSATALFRIIQEALTNVARHARASRVSVELWESEGTLVIRVLDDGRGITEQQSSAPSSFGLIGIRERVEGLGGADVDHWAAGRGDDPDGDNPPPP